MRVLVVGAGGREQAIAWACRRHGHEVILRPQVGDADDVDLVDRADLRHSVDLVIPGPEAALVTGVADRCAEVGIACFGPRASLARLESSKSYARQVADELGIPGPPSARFDDAAAAIRWWQAGPLHGGPIVVKLDGLASGKGVVVPDSDADARAAIDAAAGSGTFLIEHRMRGPECSLIALCDGDRALALPLAQDHKRIGEGDVGPNTGGMGAYAPAPIALDRDDLIATFIDPVLAHFRRAGTPYVGFLYAGLMITADGPMLVEYNVRLGDPEAQALLPLLRSDLAEVALLATQGRLADTTLLVDDKAAVTVVAAAPGYPADPRLGGTVRDEGTSEGDIGDAPAIRFDAGVDAEGRITGGRVLAVTGVGDDLASARSAAYRRLSNVHFDGMQVRRDIAWRAPGSSMRSYADAGVDIEEGARAVTSMRDAVESTHGDRVLRGLGSFGGVFSASAITRLDDPVLVASTDGVGTKVELAARLGRVRGVGHDIVNHCIDDVLVQAARPLFFLDYIAADVLDATMVAEVVGGMADACRAAGCALLGGETAEMPGVYRPGAFDIAGTLVGVAERSELLPRSDVTVGDALVGLASSGPHTNGYSLLRAIFEWIPMDVTPAGFDRTLGDTLLEPHRSYLPVLEALLAGGRVKALAHITGGGLPDNLPRVIPATLDAEVELGSWPMPPLFRLVEELTPRMTVDERYRALNMGIGMVVVCAADDVALVRAAIDEPTFVIGELVEGKGVVRLVDRGRTR
jgi:phosphoribosylamine--glycine ligase/phosphoribosylaminoimidazole synthetase